MTFKVGEKQAIVGAPDFYEPFFIGGDDEATTFIEDYVVYGDVWFTALFVNRSGLG